MRITVKKDQQCTSVRIQIKIEAILMSFWCQVICDDEDNFEIFDRYQEGLTVDTWQWGWCWCSRSRLRSGQFWHCWCCWCCWCCWSRLRSGDFDFDSDPDWDRGNFDVSPMSGRGEIHFPLLTNRRLPLNLSVPTVASFLFWNRRMVNWGFA